VLVHDYLNQYGGAERLLEAMAELAPQAPVYTSIYDPAAMPQAYRAWDVRTTWIDHAPWASRRHQWLLPAYPLAFERMQLPSCDLVLSSSSAFAKMVQPPPGAVHICYTHAPMRFAWEFERYAEREQLPRTARMVLPPYLAWLRWRDRATANRVHRFIANSTVVRDRIRAYWRRDAQVIYPPVDVERFHVTPPSEVGEHFLIVARLVPYKRIDLAVDAFSILGLPLWIVGEGRDRASLEERAGPNVRFLGRLSDDELVDVMARSRAVVFMSEDDFGIAQVEAQASGRPVIAYGVGGAQDTVIPDVTGVLVKEQSVEGLLNAMHRFRELRFDPEILVRHARQFSKSRFQHELLDFVGEALAELGNGEGDSWS
jgi:glycosyltransferase involved in cell wall biosynthesis